MPGGHAGSIMDMQNRLRVPGRTGCGWWRRAVPRSSQGAVHRRRLVGHRQAGEVTQRSQTQGVGDALTPQSCHGGAQHSWCSCWTDPRSSWGTCLGGPLPEDVPIFATPFIYSEVIPTFLKAPLLLLAAANPTGPGLFFLGTPLLPLVLPACFSVGRERHFPR